MNKGYDQFFQSARAAAKGAPPAKISRTAAPKKSSSVDRRRERRDRRRRFPWVLSLISVIGLLGTGMGMLHAEKVEAIVRRIEISWIGSASAADAAPEKTAPAAATETESARREPAAVDLDHLKNLSERKRELDARETELGRQESDLAKLKTELEGKLAELSKMREEISNMLSDRVKADDKKVDTLVEFYSNMKPQQAAKVFETMDENLAVEIMGRMKKKNAADILNLLNAEKAQAFSERFAGYKRK